MKNYILSYALLLIRQNNKGQVFGSWIYSLELREDIDLEQYDPGPQKCENLS